MKPSVIVWDVETVPDLGGFAAANDLVDKSDVEVREAIGDKFPKHIYHSIVCIGALIAHREPDCWAVDAVGAPHVGERTEKQLITRYELLRGTLSRNAFEVSQQNLADFMNTRSKAKEESASCESRPVVEL